MAPETGFQHIPVDAKTLPDPDRPDEAFAMDPDRPSPKRAASARATSSLPRHIPPSMKYLPTQHVPLVGHATSHASGVRFCPLLTIAPSVAHRAEPQRNAREGTSRNTLLTGCRGGRACVRRRCRGRAGAPRRNAGTPNTVGGKTRREAKERKKRGGIHCSQRGPSAVGTPFVG